MNNNSDKSKKVIKFIGCICIIVAIACYFTGEMVDATNEVKNNTIKDGDKLRKDLYIAATAFGWFGVLMLMISGSIGIHNAMKQT